MTRITSERNARAGGRTQQRVRVSFFRGRGKVGAFGFETAVEEQHCLWQVNQFYE